MVEFFHSNGIFIYKKCVGIIKTTKVIIIVFFGLVFQNCKTKKLAFDKTENNINNYISYNNSLNYNSNTYNITNKTEIASDSSNKPLQVQLEYSLKRLSGFCAVVGLGLKTKEIGLISWFDFRIYFLNYVSFLRYFQNETVIKIQFIFSLNQL